MKATKALPTEERVQRMNDQQWLWFYYNLKKDEEEEEDKWKHRLDYLAMFINPELARSVIFSKNEGRSENNGSKIEYTKDDQIIIEGDKIVNDSFEEEMRKALQEIGEENTLTELPDSHGAGNPLESKDDFISRVLNFQDNIPLNDVPIGIENQEEYENYLTQQPFNDQGNPLASTKRDGEIENDLEDILKKSGLNMDDIDFFDYPDE